METIQAEILETDLETTDLEKDTEDVEAENNENENVPIDVPFNPSDIRVQTRPLTLGQLVDMLAHGEIKMDTEFQRLTDLWSDTKKSRFIESLLLNLPIPMFYFDAQEENYWRVIDGLQRISTLRSFVLNKTLKLQNLEFLKNHEGKTFSDLPRELQRRINTFPITVYVLDRGTPNVVKYNIFSRINQGGLVLKPQEIRHALHQGQASDLVSYLVRSEDDQGNPPKTATEEGKLFANVTGGKVKSERMEDRDFATRFASFYLIPYIDYTPDLDSFMNKGMAKLNELTALEIQDLKDAFKKALKTAWDIFGNDAFRKRYKREDTRRPINKALFEVLMTCFSKLSQEEVQKLIQNKEIFIDKQIELLNKPDKKFFHAITTGTAKKENVLQRFKDIEKIIKETLAHD